MSDDEGGRIRFTSAKEEKLKRRHHKDQLKQMEDGKSFSSSYSIL